MSRWDMARVRSHQRQRVYKLVGPIVPEDAERIRFGPVCPRCNYGVCSCKPPEQPLTPCMECKWVEGARPGWMRLALCERCAPYVTATSPSA